MKEHPRDKDKHNEAEPVDRQADKDIVLQSRDDTCKAVVELAEHATHSLLLHTENLDAAVFDQRAFVDAVTRLILNSREARLLILIQDGRKAIQDNNRLIELSRRMSTQIQFRRPASQHRDNHKTFLLADKTAFLLCPLPGRYEGNASFANPGKVKDLNKYFTEVWDHAEPDLEIRRLHL